LSGLLSILREAPLLLLSPHFDDAALSCAALLAREEPIDVLTVFAGEPVPPRQGEWDRVTGFPDSTESRRVRLAEEQAAFADTPHRLAFLNLIESEYLTAPRTRNDAEPIAVAVDDWLEQNPGGAIAAPAGAGRLPGSLRAKVRRLMGHYVAFRHPDHVFLRNAALDALVPRPGARTVLYDEFPYLLERPADGEVGHIARSRGLSAELIAAPVDRHAKASRISVYTSQMPHLTFRGRRVDLAENLPEDERYWILISKAAR
jgi:LmbE family N-acetylglucosaminyl deacetylase